MMLPEKIIILGPNGMLGKMAVKYFNSVGFRVVEINEKYSPENRSVFFDRLSSAGSGIVINCIGRIKQKSDFFDDLMLANSILPLDLYDNLAEDQFLIHPSTDCVFSENSDHLKTINSKPIPSDYYGLSKRLGEVALLNKKNVLVVRVSIIGPDFTDSPKGLLGWFLALKPNSIVHGYINHLWNGITTLEWCKFIFNFIVNNDLRNLSITSNLIQLGTSESHNKYEILNLFQKTYMTNHHILPLNTPVNVDRRLVPTHICMSFDMQLEELKNFK